VLSIAGLVSIRLLLETAPLAVAAVIALLLGQRLQPRIQVSTYQAILRKLLLVLAIILVYQFFNENGLIPKWASE
jgi:putative Ca2+/H+ antiporter (TMEM165/GDT1 family)